MSFLAQKKVPEVRGGGTWTFEKKGYAFRTKNCKLDIFETPVTVTPPTGNFKNFKFFNLIP